MVLSVCCRGMAIHMTCVVGVHRSQVLIEKHWRGVTGRPVVEFFWEEVCKHDKKTVCACAAVS